MTDGKRRKGLAASALLGGVLVLACLQRRR